MRKFDKIKKRAYHRRWIAKNKDKVKKYYTNNIEKRKEYYAKNREHILERMKGYYQRKKLEEFEHIAENVMDVKDGFKSIEPKQRKKKSKFYYDRENRKTEKRKRATTALGKL